MHATVTKIKYRIEKHRFNNESWGGDQEIFIENQRKVLRSKGTAGYWEEICRWVQSIRAAGMLRTTRATCFSGKLCTAPKTAQVSSITPGVGRGTLSLLITIQVETMRIRGYNHTISASLMMICILRGCSQPSHQHSQPSKGTGIYAMCCSMARLAFITIVTINLFYHSCREKCGGASGAAASPWVAVGQPRAVGTFLPCCAQGTFRGLLGFPSNGDESNLAAAPSQNTAASPSLRESRLLAQTHVTASFMLESWRPQQLMTVDISLL